MTEARFRDYRLTVMIPAHNEADRIAPTLKDYGAFFSSGTEILVLLDHCDDGTEAVVRKHEEMFPNIRHKTVAVSHGKGAALIEGFREAKGDIIAYTDADGATSAEELGRIVSAIGDYDAIIGSRWLPESVIVYPQTFVRRIASRVFNILVRAMFGLSIRDTQCGAKAFKRHVIDRIQSELGTTSFAIDVDMLYLMKKHGFKVREFPTVWADKRESTLVLRKASPVMFAAIVRLRLKHSPLARFLKRL